MPLIPLRMSGALAAAMCLTIATADAQGTQGQPAASPPAPQATNTSAPARTPAPHDAYVYIGWPLDGATVNGNHVKVWFGTRNFGIAPAGVSAKNTGHHHLLIDVPVPPLDQPIPNDRNHLHFGLGQTETVIELPPGKHTLQLIMGDADHVPHDPALISRRITIYVRG
jgi:hypothetical protein